MSSIRQIQVGKRHCRVLYPSNPGRETALPCPFSCQQAHIISPIKDTSFHQSRTRQCRVPTGFHRPITHHFTGQSHIISTVKQTSFQQSSKHHFNRTRQCRVPTGFHRLRIKANRFHPSNKGHTPWPRRVLH